ncbi:TrbI/VirB10 family protein [Serratia marcescens]
MAARLRPPAAWARAVRRSSCKPRPAAAGATAWRSSNGGQGDRWKLDSQPEAPRTPFELRAGFVVPATLISGINSDLPGQIMAQVAQDVYDTPTGKHLLIPQGSRLVGSYSSDVAYGQARVLVAWQRIVFPDGKAMDIGAMPGADSAGYAGFHDQVNNHYVRLFGSAFLMSGVTAGITYSQRQNQATNTYGAPSASSALSEALGQQLGQVTAQLIAKNLSISPTLEIRPGYRFNVVVTKDMTFSKPYRSFDY